MLRVAGFAAAAAALAPPANHREVAHCVEITSTTAELEACHIAAMADPEWVHKYSVAAAGPEQISIAYGSTPDAMTIGWATADASAQSVVEWGTTSGKRPNKATGNATSYKYGTYTSPTLHQVWLSGLPLNTTVFYVVGDATTGQSAEQSFVTNPGTGSTDAYFPYRIAFIADVGESSAAETTVQHVVDSMAGIDMVSINGDISYASGCELTGCTVWDAWGRLSSSFSSSLPFHVNVGNHETYDNNGVEAISVQTRYRGQPFQGRADGVWYFSYEAGPVHVISASSFYPQGFASESPLRSWLEADLAGINHTATPWVLFVLHAPWYNSNTEHQGDGETMRQALEQLLISNGVSAVFGGHVHAYERSHPVNNNKVVPPGPGGLTHLNIGDGGASLYTKWTSPQPAWSAIRSATWGHGQLDVLNLTHAHWTWHQNNASEPTIADDVYILNANPKAFELAAQRQQQLHHQ